jgi:osmotically-inducible protein OsmY
MLATALALVVSASLASAAPRDAVLTNDDAALRQQIEHRFETSPTLKGQDLTVSVEDRVVTVTGVVDTSAVKARALQLAKVKGISRVENQIEVNAAAHDSRADAVGDKSKAGVDKGVDATVNAVKKTTQAVGKSIGKAEEGVGKAADKTAEGVGKAGGKMADLSITTRVKASLRGETLLNGSDVDVKTTDRVVTLTGRVSSYAARDRSIEIVGSLDGVQRVIDELHVETP